MRANLPVTFGRYTLTELLGEGGMAEVYRASVRVAEGLTKWVVIKRIRPEFANDAEFTRMFVDEAKIALGLNHANIVQVFDFGQVRGDFYLAMELIEGIDLMRLFHAVRSPGEVFPPVIAAYIAHQVASGLAYAHRKRDDYGQPLGIVHRDVSPHNLMLSWEGQIKILDFGIARARDPARSPDARPAEFETIKGKVAYMSPEQAMGRPVDPRSDVYSLGVVLYELLSGELLYRGRDRLAALEQVRTSTIPPLVDRAPDLPDDLVRIVDRALARDPERRFPNARELQAALAEFLHRSDPVVDDDVISRFLARFRGEDRGPRTTGSTAAMTREIADTQNTVGPVGLRRAPQRVLLVAVALQPRAADGDRVLDVSPVVELLRSTAFKRDAHLHRIDAGGALMVFGAVLTTGDDPERAVRAALSVREAIAELAPGVGLGLLLASGVVFVTTDEHDKLVVELPRGLERTLESIAGSAVDRAILVAGEVAERLRRSWHLVDDPALGGRLAGELEGTPWAAELDSISALEGPRSEGELRAQQWGGGRTPLVGREIELKSLRDAFSDAIRSRQSRALLIVGDSGLGKRALVDRFASSLPRGACWVLRGIGQWSTRNVPLWAFVEMLRKFLQVEAATPIAEIERRLVEYDVREANELAVALAESIGTESLGVALEPRERRDRVRRLVRRLLSGLAARRPVLLIVENLHFLDSESLTLLSAWATARHGAPILGVVTSRESNRVEALAVHANVGVIRLRELDERSRRAFVLDRFEDPEDAAELAAAILARTGGNPLYIEEVLGSLLRRGVLGWNPQATHLVVRDRHAPIDLPPSVEAAVQQRIDDLPDDVREALQAAAVLGRSFRPEELRRLLGRAVTHELEVLVERKLLEIDVAPGPDGPRLLRFCTVSQHEVARGGMSATSLASLHSRAGDLKAARADYRIGRDDGPIAEHLFEAGRADEAIDPALRAAREASHSGASAEAFYYLGAALQATSSDDPRRFELLLLREPILRAWGRRRAQGADIRQLVAMAERSGDDELVAIAHLRLLRFYLECGRVRRASHILGRVQTMIQRTQSPRRHLADLGELRSDLAFALGDLEDADALARNALSYCETDATGQRQRCRLLACLGRIRLASGQHGAARSCFDEMLEIAQSLPDRRLEGEALDHLGRVAGRSSDYQAAVDHFRAALAIDRELGDRINTGTKLANLGITYTELGLHRRAERYLRKALELHEATGHPGLLNDAMISFGVVLSEVGDPEGAAALLEDAAEVARQRGDERAQLRARARLAQVELRRGRADAAAVAAEAVLLRAREGTYRTSRVRALLVLASIAKDRGDKPSAIFCVEQAVGLVREGAAPIDGVLALHLLGTLRLEAGDESEAHALLREAGARVRQRLERLRDPELRAAYLALPEVASILGDAELQP